MDNSGNNRYELLFMDEDSAAQTVIVQPEPKKKEPAVVKNPQPNKKVHAEKENKAAVNKKHTETREQRNNRRNNDEKVTTGNNEAGSNENRQVRRDYREFRDNRGPDHRENRDHRGPDNRDNRGPDNRDNRGPPRSRFGDGGHRGPKREFDRQSGSDKTGIKAVDKRDGAGAHNWGSVKQEIDDINKSSTDVDTAVTDKDESGNEQTSEQPIVPEEPETPEMTLDEYKALMLQKRTKPQFNLRKAGEGEDTAQWKKMVALNKKKEGDSEEEFEYDPSMYPQRVGRLQRIVDIQFNFKDGRRGGGGFGRGGTRGRGRGDRFGKGVFEGARTEVQTDEIKYNQGRSRNLSDKRGGSNALKVDDERQFPTLG